MWSCAAWISEDEFVKFLMLDEAGMHLRWRRRRKVEHLLGFHFASSSFLYNDRICSTATCF